MRKFMPTLIVLISTLAGARADEATDAVKKAIEAHGGEAVLKKATAGELSLKGTTMALGAEVAFASAHDPDQLAEALKGVQRAYYVPIFAPHATQAAAAFAAAAEGSRLEAVIQLSQWLSHPAHPSILTRETWLIDRLFARIPGVASPSGP